MPRSRAVPDGPSPLPPAGAGPGTAAPGSDLPLRDDDLAALGGEHARGRGVDLAKEGALHAAGKHPDAAAAPRDPGAPPEAVATVTLDGRTTTVPMPSAADPSCAAEITTSTPTPAAVAYPSPKTPIASGA